MDGTLADNLPVHDRAWQLFLKNQGRDLPLEEVAALAFGTEIECVRRMLGDHLSEAETARLGAEKEALYRKMYAPEMAARAGLFSFLEKAKRDGFRIALGTAGGRGNVDFLVGGLGLFPFFEAVVSAEDVKKGKPDPEVFLLAAEKLGVEPKNCLVFEDSDKGIEAAKMADMAVVAVGLKTPDAFLATVGEAFKKRILDFENLEPNDLF